MAADTVTRMHATGGDHDDTDAIDRDRIAYTIKDTARLLSLSTRKVRYLVASGELPSIKVGSARRVHGSAIERYARQHTTPGTQERAS